ncbi:MAG: carboxymuconolactone decarboxylase family protein [Candidatus Hodarchaeales archaeon]
MNKLTKREKEITFLAASIAAGCIPCLNHHKLEARAAGITQDELLRIAKYAFLVRRKADKFNIGKLDTVLIDDEIQQIQSEESSEDLEESPPCCG